MRRIEDVPAGSAGAIVVGDSWGVLYAIDLDRLTMVRIPDPEKPEVAAHFDGLALPITYFGALTCGGTATRPDSIREGLPLVLEVDLPTEDGLIVTGPVIGILRIDDAEKAAYGLAVRDA